MKYRNENGSSFEKQNFVSPRDLLKAAWKKNIVEKHKFLW